MKLNQISMVLIQIREKKKLEKKLLSEKKVTNVNSKDYDYDKLTANQTKN